MVEPQPQPRNLALPLAAEIQAALAAAFRLARFEPQGLAGFNLSVTGFWRSFLAVPLALPLVLLIEHLASLAPLGRGPVVAEIAGDGPALLPWLLAYGLKWLVFPLAALPLAYWLKFGERYVALIVAYNWAQLAMLLVVLAEKASRGLGFSPAMQAMLASGLFLWILIYEWYVVRTALGPHGFLAVGLVVIDLMLSDAYDVVAGM